MFIEKKQEKTGAVVVIPLSETARKYLPRRGLLNKARPFECLPSYSSVTRYMRIWGAAAGLEKRLTFHVSRHTFGTQLVSNGVELLTASKLMGHTNVTTTQIYAEVVTAARVAAVDKLPTFERVWSIHHPKASTVSNTRMQNGRPLPTRGGRSL